LFDAPARNAHPVAAQFIVPVFAVETKRLLARPNRLLLFGLDQLGAALDALVELETDLVFHQPDLLGGQEQLVSLFAYCLLEPLTVDALSLGVSEVIKFRRLGEEPFAEAAGVPRLKLNLEVEGIPKLRGPLGAPVARGGGAQPGVLGEVVSLSNRLERLGVTAG